MFDKLESSIAGESFKKPEDNLFGNLTDGPIMKKGNSELKARRLSSHSGTRINPVACNLSSEKSPENSPR